MKDVVVVGEEEGGFYKLKGHLWIAHVHETTRSSEIWHRNISHINYKALPYVSKVVTGLPSSKDKTLGNLQGMCTGKEHKESLSKKLQNY